MLLNPYRFFIPITVCDLYWNNVSSLLHFNGANGSTTFTDEKGSTWSASGSVPLTLDTNVKKFGTSSIKGLNGTAGSQRLSLNEGVAQPFGFGTGDYTIEFYVRPSTEGTPSYATILQNNNGSINNALYFNNNNSFLCRFAGNYTDIGATGIVPNQWYHLAMVRFAGVGYFFVDGILKGTQASTSNFGTACATSLFSTLGGGNPFAGYIDEFRVTKGVARYTSNFTPPTEEFPSLAC